jgi:hypothetical protein
MKTQHHYFACIGNQIDAVLCIASGARRGAIRFKTASKAAVFSSHYLGYQHCGVMLSGIVRGFEVRLWIDWEKGAKAGSKPTSAIHVRSSPSLLFLWANEKVFVCVLSLVKFACLQILIHEMIYDLREQHLLGLR